MSNEKVLITGGAGFIGSFVCRALVERNYHPIVYDSYTYYFDPLKCEYQKNLKKRFEGIEDNITMIRGDTRNKSYLQRLIMEKSPTRIIHLAALSVANLSNKYSEESVSTTIGGAVNIFEIIREVDFVKRFVYISSSMIYGDFQYFPADEKHPKNPKEVYGGCKYAGEIMTQAFGKRFGIEYCIIRPSAVYGPTDVNRRVVQIFVENAMQKKKLMIHGAETKLDFTYVKDTAEGIILATLSPNAKNEIFNITRGEGRTLGELVEILRNYFPDLQVEVKELPNFRPKRGALGISKAKKLLGFKPKYSLEKGLEEYIKFYKEEKL